MSNPLISIIIPLYNAEKWLAETINSALSQSWSRKEIIIVDDGSTDDSLAVARSIRSPQVLVIEQENCGASTARNRGLSAAQGEYFQYLDADDLLAEEKLTKQVRLLANNPQGCVAVCATRHFFDGTDQLTSKFLDDFGPLLGDSDDPVDWLLRLYGLNGNAGMVPLHAWLTPRSVAEQAGDWDTTLTTDDDGDYFNRVLLACAGVRTSNFVGAYYRKHRDNKSLSAAKTWNRQRSILTALEHKTEQILQRVNNPKARRAFARHFFERAFHTYPDYPDLSAEALRHHQELGGGCEHDFHFGRLELVRRIFGWQAACQVRAAKRRFIQFASWLKGNRVSRSSRTENENGSGRNIAVAEAEPCIR